MLSGNKAKNLNTLEEVRWKVDRCVLVGNSYGGGIAISALGTCNLANAAIAFCPLLEPSKQNLKNDEDDLITLYPYLERCHENVFRHLDKKEWQHYLDGTHPANPTKFIDKIINKPLLLVHGAMDKSILPYHTENFHRELIHNGSSKADILIQADVGHGKELRISTKDSWIKWLINRRNDLWTR
ncbi:alpha/beta hydrolase family protein [Virgibacillus flavescens]|uniref:alpha/beta hydrolase family protein n=1 Tax=Virgibacillus flavescens TaxID=1611422 RepID=UPI003D33599E